MTETQANYVQVTVSTTPPMGDRVIDCMLKDNSTLLTTPVDSDNKIFILKDNSTPPPLYTSYHS